MYSTNERFFLEKEEDSGSTKFPIGLHGNIITELSHHRRTGNKHINHKKHHRPLHPSPTIPGSSHKSLQEKPHSRNRIDTPSFNSHRFVLFFLTFSFLLSISVPLSLHLFSDVLVLLFPYSSLPTRSSLSQLLQKFSSCIAVYS